MSSCSQRQLNHAFPGTFRADFLGRGIGFRSLTEALDTTTAQGRLVFHMFGARAEFERTLIRERSQAGLAAARRAGPDGRATAEADGG